MSANYYSGEPGAMDYDRDARCHCEHKPKHCRCGKQALSYVHDRRGRERFVCGSKACRQLATEGPSMTWESVQLVKVA